jgi:hypothetical protein
MRIDAIPIWIQFVGTILIVMLFIDLGYRFGRIIHRRSTDEKESPVSAIAGSVLGLVAFMLAFTFGIVAERYDARKGLVREEANTVRTAWLRSEFLPESDRAEAARLLRQYVDERLDGIRLVQTHEKTLEHMTKVLADAERIQTRLWDMAVLNARKDMNSDVAALYLDSLNQLIEIHASRVAIGLQQRIPSAIWIVLFGLTFCGMALVGYQTGIAGSKQSWARPFLAVSFGMVIALIAALDRPDSLLKVSQQPLVDLQHSMTSSPGGAPSSHQPTP